MDSRSKCGSCQFVVVSAKVHVNDDFEDVFMRLNSIKSWRLHVTAHEIGLTGFAWRMRFYKCTILSSS